MSSKALSLVLAVTLALLNIVTAGGGTSPQCAAIDPECDACPDPTSGTRVDVNQGGEMLDGIEPDSSSTFCWPCGNVSEPLVDIYFDVASGNIRNIGRLYAPQCSSTAPLYARVRNTDTMNSYDFDFGYTGVSVIPSHVTVDVRVQSAARDNLDVYGELILDSNLDLLTGSVLTVKNGGHVTGLGGDIRETGSVVVEAGGILRVDERLQVKNNVASFDIFGELALYHDFEADVTTQLNVKSGGVVRTYDAAGRVSGNGNLAVVIEAGGLYELNHAPSEDYNDAIVVLDGATFTFNAATSTNRFSLDLRPGSSFYLNGYFDQRANSLPNDDISGVTLYMGASGTATFVGQTIVATIDTRLIGAGRITDNANFLNLAGVTVVLGPTDVMAFNNADNVNLQDLRLELGWNDSGSGTVVIDLASGLNSYTLTTIDLELGDVSSFNTDYWTMEELILAPGTGFVNSFPGAPAVAGGVIVTPTFDGNPLDTACFTARVVGDTSGVRLNVTVACPVPEPTTTTDDADTNADGDDDEDEQSGLNPGILIGAGVGALALGGFIMVTSRSSNKGSSDAFAGGMKSSASSTGRSQGSGSTAGSSSETIESAIATLIDNFDTRQLVAYVGKLVDQGKLDAALALALKVEQEAAGGPVKEYMLAVECVGTVMDALGDNNAKKAVTRRKAAGAGGAKKSLANDVGMKQAYSRATRVYKKKSGAGLPGPTPGGRRAAGTKQKGGAPPKGGRRASPSKQKGGRRPSHTRPRKKSALHDSDLWDLQTVRQVVQTTPIGEWAGDNDQNSDMVTLTSEMAPM